MYHTFNRPRPKVMVVSHERSGTHFLMNSLAAAYGYIATRWVNLDRETGINFYHPPSVAGFFNQFQNIQLANVVKSHHPFAFFQSILGAITRDFHIFYLYRDPRDVMVSFWKFLPTLHWHEGPKTATCSDFIRAQPCGQMMRYQYQQEPSLLHRWRTHVDSWTLGVPPTEAGRVTFVRFRDLAHNYAGVMKSLAPIFGEDPISLDKPAVQHNSILPGSGKVGGYRDYFNQADLDHFQQVAGPTIQRLGFDENETLSSSQPSYGVPVGSGGW